MAGIFRKRPKQERAGYGLYAAAVTAARDPFLYTALGVPDTLDGRFDAICLHVFLLIRRLNAEAEPGVASGTSSGAAAEAGSGAELAQAVFDAMFHDMDINLREMGVSDLSVGKRNRAMWEALHGRAAAYTEAWAEQGQLAAAIGRNVWRGIAAPEGAAASLARLAQAQAANLAGQSFAALAAGEVHFLPAEEALR